jgi:isoleucyl-tRNA synthetase
MFEPLPSKFSFPDSEAQILSWWKEHDIFGQSLRQRAGAERFVFYEGPPTANGLPHPGHCLTRAMKDLFPRYQTMCGKLVERKAGWDTHGLPVEVEVCKELGIHTKEEIEAYGVEKFVRLCIQSVFKYTREWEELTERLGFWVNLDDAYVTFHQSYVESVWWGLKTLFERGLLYQGHKVVWWWAQGGTALSSGEVGEGYRTVDDPSVFVKFPLVGHEHAQVPVHMEDQPISLLVWTTTPWTLISNHFAAVHPELEYALVRDPELDEYLYIAKDLVEAIGNKVKRELEIVSTYKGAELIGLRYQPPFPNLYYTSMGEQTATLKDGGAAHIGWRVTAADFVTTDSGSGLVHEAPAFGEVDFELLQNERQRFDNFDAIPLINAVKPDGTFSDEAPEAYRGRWVKNCDKEITRELRDRRLLYHQEQYRHDYPFCPRAEDDALIQYARKSWFVRTSQFKDEFLENNDQIKWLPEHIKEGRFGDFLRNNVDWALSRERFWGTPLPVWVCDNTGQMEAIGSMDELRAKPGATDGGLWEQKKAADPELPDHLMVHKPYIDAWTYDSPFEPGAKMRRVTEVIDCWWDAGSMPFAQWGFPHAEGSVERVRDLPANFISEALDQTRGWFYGLLAISTLLFGKNQETSDSQTLSPNPYSLAPAFPHPYKTCIVLGLMMGEDGLKMSKRKKNYREPSYIFDEYGADALRWFLFSGQTPWTSIRFQESNISNSHREFLVRLYNVFSFFNIYANIDSFEVTAEGGTGWRPVAQRSELDRWMISEMQRAIRDIRESMDKFENYPATQTLNALVDALSNWFVRRSRDRFWRSEKDADKWDAYNTLYETLLTLSKLIAPFTPFFAERMYQNLTQSTSATDSKAASADPTRTPDPDPQTPLSVHLCDYPAVDEALIDEALAQEMSLVRTIVSLGRSARTQGKLKVRQPLQKAEIILANQAHRGWLEAHAPLMAEELNIKQIEFTEDADHYVSYQVKPNFKALGPKFGKLAPQIGKALQSIDAAAARRSLVDDGKFQFQVNEQSVELTPDEVEIRLEAKDGWSAAQERGAVVVVSTELTPELIEEGLVRELIHHVQALRKEHDLAYEARIALYIETGDELKHVIERQRDTLARECLMNKLAFELPADASPTEVSVESHAVKLALQAQ